MRLLLLLLGSLHVWTALVVPMAGMAPSAARVPLPARMAADNPPPPEVIEAESNATPNRKY